MLDVLKEYNTEELGLTKTDKEEKKIFPPLKDLTSPVGLCFPAFDPHYDFPFQWRCRLYKPWKLKVQAQWSIGLGTLPLGLHLPISRLRNDPIDLLLITEGEPDYLSMYEAWRQLWRLGLRKWLDVISVVSGDWKQEWDFLLRDAKKIIICTHETQHGKDVAGGVARATILLHGRMKASQICKRYLFDENQDANDFLRQGKLTEWLKPLF